MHDGQIRPRQRADTGPGRITTPVRAENLVRVMRLSDIR
jgi:hypothetical protein